MAKASAGLVLYRRPDRGPLEVLLVHPGGPFWAKRDEGAWSIPKGELDPGDADALRAAEREFREELGLEVPHGRRFDLGWVTQAGGKRVSAWALEAPGFDPTEVTSNEFEIEWPPRSGRLQSFPEVDRVSWCDSHRARRLLIPAQVAFVDRLEAALAAAG